MTLPRQIIVKIIEKYLSILGHDILFPSTNFLAKNHDVMNCGFTINLVFRITGDDERKL
jgi:hypothetical protein